MYEPGGPDYSFRIRAIARTPDDIAGNDVGSVGSTAYGTASSGSATATWRSSGPFFPRTVPCD